MAASYLTSTRTILKAARCRSLLVSPAASLCSSRTGPRSGLNEPRTAGEEPQDPEYIPRRKAKNPMMKIGYAWMIGLPTGVIGFLLAKRQVDKNRLKQLKVRQRMRRSNEGEYEGSRYHHSTEDFKLDH
uniref:Si:ch73-71c20.5 n=1 Tax=Mastacembelus armatus TaxID=205130 RepID=A0A7N8XBH1_9TELE